MESAERDRIDRITAAVHSLLQGRLPEKIVVDDQPRDEIHQLSAKVNSMIDVHRETRAFIEPLADGNLDVAVSRENHLAASFKQLQANLRHLTWQAQQIARGDFSQRVDFMGEFSSAFNTMVDALQESHGQLQAEIRKAEDHADAKSRYLNVMAHDIRTPIAAVSGFADILEETVPDESALRYVGIIRRNCDALLALINNILDLAKLDKKQMEIESFPFEPRQLVDDVGLMIEASLKEGVRFVSDVADSVPPGVTGDPHRLRQVLVNLVGNASKFTERGSITLRVCRQETGTGAGRLLFAVEDTGMGIARDVLEEIFEPFRQANAGIAARFGGTGLGLSISRELVRLMGGTLDVTSEPGEGTTFFFSLPFEEAVAEKDDPGRRDRPRTAGSGRILVVDDDPDFLDIVSRSLSKRNAAFETCSNGADALELLDAARSSDEPFTAAWLDLNLPDIGGIDLAERIRSDRRFDDVPLVACSSNVDQALAEDRARLFSFMATKPLTAGSLDRLLEAASTGSGTRADDMIDITGLRVLVVDDNVINRMMVKLLLKKYDVTVTEAESGPECLNAVERDEINVILMDHMMPGMDGVETTRRLRLAQGPDELPIFAFTATSFEEVENAFLAAGANAVLHKPVNREELMQCFADLGKSTMNRALCAVAKVS